MKINIICVGKVKEKYLREAIAEYTKRLSRYCTLNIIEVQDEKTPEHAPAAIEERIKEIEGKRILEKLPERALVIVLAIEGEMVNSEELAKKMSTFMQKSGELCFVIGGSLGLSPEVLKRADWKLSFSPMTFPHQLMRVILLEQIYRAFKINAHEPYHK
jgi:23S rRNA (pseudouridine1915-N3)-methyltransferase